MRLRSTLLVLLVVGLVAVPAGSAALPFYWWTNAKAGRQVIAKNPQLFSATTSAHTLITRASCKGHAPLKRYRGVRYYRLFLCTVTVSEGPTKPTFPDYLVCNTTRTRQPGIRCTISA